MPRQYPPIPPPEDLLKLVTATLSNAGELLADAQRLADAGSFPRAHALATYASEEQGKSQLCTIVLVMHSSVEFNPKAFWDEFTSHTEKLGRARKFDGLFVQEPPASVMAFVQSLAAWSATLHGRKMRGLYVDYTDGRVLTPDDVTEQEARELIAQVGGSLAMPAAILGAPGAADLMIAFSRTNFAALLDEMQAALATDVDTVAARYRDVMHQAHADFISSPEIEGEDVPIPSPAGVTEMMRQMFERIGLVPPARDMAEPGNEHEPT